MTDNLVSRVKRLVSGSVNNIVDVVENASPETVMKEAIREVESAMNQVRHELGEVIAAKHLANRRLLEANTKHEDLAEKIGVAVEQGRDDLAEAAIARQLDIETQIPVMESAISDASHQEGELETYVLALQARKREMEEELNTFTTAQRSNAPGTVAGATSSGSSGSVETRVSKADQAFSRVMNTASGVSGVATLDQKSAQKIAELEQLARDNRVHERLATLKASISKNGG